MAKTIKATSVLRGAQAVKVLLGVFLAALAFGLLLNLTVHELTKTDKPAGVSRLPARSTNDKATDHRSGDKGSSSLDEDNDYEDYEDEEDDEDDDDDIGVADSEEILGGLDDTRTRISDMRRQTPKVLIVGFSNCWTMTLSDLLSLHPDIVTANREMRYFTHNHGRGDEWYRSMMPLSAPHQITVERTRDYITSSTALHRIHNFNPEMKIIALVRDPVLRLMSTYALQTRRIEDRPNFEHWCGVKVKTRNVLRYIDYATYIEKAISRFSRENVLVLSKEDLETKPHTTLKTVENFLGLQPAFSENDFSFNKEEQRTCFRTESVRYPEVRKALARELDRHTGCLGNSMTRGNHPNIDQDFLEKLLQLVKIHNNRLFSLIEKKFDWTSPHDL